MGPAAVRATALLHIGEIQGQVLVNRQFVILAMPIEQQRLLATQQAGKVGETGPKTTLLFYICDKLLSVGSRAINTVAFVHFCTQNYMSNWNVG